jgi:hypothetical protein
MRWLVAVAVAACGSAPARPAGETRGVLVVRSAAPAAVLWVDEHPVGEVGKLAGGVRLHAGAHRVELRLDGYHTRYAEVTVREGETQVVELGLTEEQP